MDPHAVNAKRGRGFGSCLLVLPEARGVGSCLLVLPEARGFGSCLLVLPEALLDSWQFEKCSDKYCVWFDEKGKRYKSSCVISFDLNGNRYEVGQVKHRSMNTSCIYPLCRIARTSKPCGVPLRHWNTFINHNLATKRKPDLQ